MKKLVILFVLSVTISALGQEENPFPNDINMMAIDTTVMQQSFPPSFYLKRASNRMMVSLGCGVATGVLSVIGVSAVKESRDLNLSLFFGMVGALGVFSLIEFVGAINDLGRAGTALERIHLRGNGVSIDF